MIGLKAESVVKKFANHLALDELSLDVPEGSIYGLLGPNGAGKTTFIRIINQITAPDSGKVYINKELLSPKHVATIGYLPEERGLYKKMKVGEQSLYLARLKGLSKKDALLRLKYWFEKFEIESWWDKKIEELSKGMQQKVQFITTVLHQPKLLIFDEPFSGFDPINANLLKKEILELSKNGATIIFSTHNMSSVEEICDNIALINNSRKILEGPIDSIRKEHSSDMFEIEYEGYFNKLLSTLTSDYKIVEIVETPEKSKIKVELINKEIDSNTLISRMSEYGSIMSFNRHYLSMNDIFIKLVEQTNSNIKKEEKTYHE
jgi:ABC-2 type transport system ATP-binding protein